MRRIHRFSAASSLALVTACGAQFETTDGVATTDPLYAQVKTQCGDDALVLRAVDMVADEALCCLTFTAFIPSVHCMTASGGQITNPASASKLLQISKEAKAEKIKAD